MYGPTSRRAGLSPRSTSARSISPCRRYSSSGGVPPIEFVNTSSSAPSAGARSEITASTISAAIWCAVPSGSRLRPRPPGVPVPTPLSPAGPAESGVPPPRGGGGGPAPPSRLAVDADAALHLAGRQVEDRLARAGRDAGGERDSDRPRAFVDAPRRARHRREVVAALGGGAGDLLRQHRRAHAA